MSFDIRTILLLSFFDRFVGIIFYGVDRANIQPVIIQMLAFNQLPLELDIQLLQAHATDHAEQQYCSRTPGLAFRPSQTLVSPRTHWETVLTETRKGYLV